MTVLTVTDALTSIAKSMETIASFIQDNRQDLNKIVKVNSELADANLDLFKAFDNLTEAPWQNSCSCSEEEIIECNCEHTQENTPKDGGVIVS